MSGPSTGPGLRMLASDASGLCEPDSDVCAVPDAEPPVSAEGTPDGIDEDARAGD